MGRNLNDIHNLIELVERKETGAFHTHAQIDSALAAGGMELFKQYLDEYINSKDKKLPAALYPFRKKDSFTSDANGEVDIPGESEHLILLYCTSGINTYPVRMVDELELPDAINSQLRKVTTEKPIGIEEYKLVQLYPPAVRTGIYVYLRAPKSPEYVYTQTGRVINYDDSGSTQIEFSEIYWDKIVAKALSYLGINMSEADIVNFGNVKDAQIVV